MKKIFFIILFYISNVSYSQISLGKNADKLIDEITSTNDVVLLASYQSKPLVVHFTKEIKMTEFYKTFFFLNNLCISETHLFPLSQFDTHFAILKLRYGVPEETNFAGNNVFVWHSSNGLNITMSKRTSRFCDCVVTSIDYSFDKDIKKINDATMILTSGLTEYKFLKNIE